MDKKYTAGELARWAGISARTIRFYEEKGILRPRERSAEGYRLYDDSAIVRLQEILMLKHVGLSLEEIQQVLQQGEELSVSELLARQRELVLEEWKQAFTTRMERLFSEEFGRVSQTTFHNSLRIGHSEELLRYLYDVDGELEMRIKSREQEVRRYLQELIRQGQTPEIGTTAHCYCCE